ncbi:MAG: hypothetical protein AAGG44_09465 [Planctomycetota bacterium]
MTESQPSDLLSGRSLLWASFDTAGAATSMIRLHLRQRLDPNEIRCQHLVCSSPDWSEEDAPELSGPIGLRFWNIELEDDFARVSRSLRSAKKSSFPTVSLVLIPPQYRDWISILIEAGAQIVVTDVPSLQRVLDSLFPAGQPPRIACSEHGFHPITSGLVERLPWPEIDNPPPPN